ncbi:MAG: nitroreductase family protein [Candidatus Muiribacteriota bacterium]
MKGLLERRSIRKYKNTEVEEEKIEMLLKAGMSAPSAKGTEPWHFFVIRNREILKKLSQIHPYAKMLENAPMAILVCFDEENEEARDWFVQDLSAATENILVMATELDLGSVWLGVYPREDRVEGIKKLMGFEDDFLPFSLIAVGYADEKKEPKQDFSDNKVGYID